MRSLKKKIMLPVILVASIGLLSLALMAYTVSKRIIINHVEAIAEEKVAKLVVNVENEFEHWKEEMEKISAMNAAQELDYNAVFKYVEGHRKFFEEYEIVLISDTDGNYEATNGVSGNISDRDYFHKTLEGQTVISDPKISKSTGNPIIVVSAPIRDDEGNIIGLSAGTVNLSVITDIINDEKFGNYGYAYMFDSHGATVAHPTEYDLFKNSSDDLKNIIIKMISGEEGTGYYFYNGEKKIVSFKPVKSTGWSIGMSAYYDEMTKSIERLKLHVFIISILTVILIGGVLYFLTNACVKPINKLKECMEVAANGDLTVQSDIKSDDEIGVLSNSFNTLINENKRLLEEAIEYDKLKTEFFSNISHELRTPLNMIFSTMQLLSLHIDNGELDSEKLNKHINRVNQNSYRLLRLVDNIIDITKIDSGFKSLHLQNRNIVEVVENITLSTVDYVKSKSREIIFDTEVEEKILAFDSEQMERIILNLISNAVKFTNPNDKIEVNIYDKKESVWISVKDTGIGISEDKQEIIFERFRQADPLYIRENEGSGIGLSLVKSLVEMHDGNISVISKCGEGTEFIIEMPVKLVSKEENGSSIEEFMPQCNIEKINIEFSDIYP
ncbi:Signal transduction histidine kinase [Peptoclostridium litorale DSM 5388]|uniref:histidine kinase n=1 Tax=Peptoclostridium litorale DSM 5388 TaxID=1121324 RepID=A0A069RH02_PEPLI|nr:HAMP domain-containing histidine kinase [Peptoclostridium litorale]KDR95450.1 sensor histidine kinase ResE [Peptoclostridium litorale DSM 5388]SIO18471.1 Signal transduction histidine kinase [Peptoclostridium litorale DSM 5388]